MEPLHFTAEDRAILAGLAREGLRLCANCSEPPVRHWPPLPAALRRSPLYEWRTGTFITLRRSGELRGCMGHLRPQARLPADTRRNSCRAGCQDPRFPRVLPAELKELEIHITLLTQPKAIVIEKQADFIQRIVPGQGVLVQEKEKTATFLPAVWEMLPQPADFLQQLLGKAGIRAWSPDIRFFTYSALLDISVPYAENLSGDPSSIRDGGIGGQRPQ